MKIFAISDLHLAFCANKPMDIFGGTWENYLDEIVDDWQKKVSDDDVVVLAGDLSWAMKLSETKQDFEFLSKLKGKKIIIRGNHDYWWSSISAVRNALPSNVYALQNDAIKIENYIFCGTRCWTVPEKNFETELDEKIYKREVLRLEMSLDCAKRLQTNNEKIICITHFPPINSSYKENEFTNLISKYNVNKVIYGHLHGNKVRCNLKHKIQNTEYYLTSCDLLKNKLVLIDRN